MTTEIIMMTLFRKGKETMIRLTVLTSPREQESHIERKGSTFPFMRQHRVTGQKVSFSVTQPSTIAQCHLASPELRTEQSWLQCTLSQFNPITPLSPSPGRQGRRSVREFNEPLRNGISAAQGSEGPSSSMNLPPSQAKKYLHAQGSYLSIAINNACKFVSNQCVEGAALENGNYYGHGFTGSRSGNTALLMPYFYQNQLNASYACNSMEAVNAGISVEMPWSSFQTPTTVQSGTENSSLPVGHSAGSCLEGSKTLPVQGSEEDGASYEDPVDDYLNWDDTCTNILAIDYGRFDLDGGVGTSK
ncbi:hypothetical protein NC653_033763 [Populus alba x Populus x berolinensis]|uniref:Uncharacterized protein n=1 Tax=Populus alba x Populus x berolinensis TaxID=444605 RepID=A0AAD6LXB5_9ROSI|nr:hypothetical protein NC653_033763 [Populus alba x Populus x berolinensis]